MFIFFDIFPVYCKFVHYVLVLDCKQDRLIIVPYYVYISSLTTASTSSKYLARVQDRHLQLQSEMDSLPERMEGVGLIIPPPEVRNILETTATFVGRKPALESKVRQRHQDDPRFTFLHPSDPYHAYFRQRVAQFRAPAVSNGPDESDHIAKSEFASNTTNHAVPTQNPSNPVHSIASEQPKTSTETINSPSATDQSAQNSVPVQRFDENNVRDHTEEPVLGQSSTQGAAVISTLKAARAKAEASRPEPLEPPPDDQFSLPVMNPPPNALALDVMRLAAQFVAKFGTEFQVSLSEKERRNPLFDFLKPMHPHFLAFQRLIDAYKIILDKGKVKERLLSQLKKQADDSDVLLNETWYIHDWECQRAEKKHEAALDEREKVRLAQIDWHDFVVVATIDFDDAEIAHLPHAVSDAKQLPKMLAAGRKAQAEREKNKENVDMDIDESVRPREEERLHDHLASEQQLVHPPVAPSQPSIQKWGSQNSRQPQQLPLPPSADPVLPTPKVPVKNASLSNASGPVRIAGSGEGTISNVIQGAVPKGSRVQLVDVDSDIPEERIRRVPSVPSKITGKASGETNEATVVLPSGQRVPLSKAESSMRAELLDPSYKLERARAAEKNKQQNLAGGEEVARNLARLEQGRHDSSVFNRADLQEALSERRKVPDAIVGAKVKKGIRAGPELPPVVDGAEDNGMTPPAAKRAKVEAAVGALSKKSGLVSEAEVETEGVEVAKDVGAAVETPSGLVPAEEWIKRQGTKAKVHIKVCHHSNEEWKLQGQEIEMFAPLESTVSKLKNVMMKYTNLPANKQKLQMEKIGFLKDQMTLAFYNIGDGAVILLEVKERGGRKKH